MARGRLWEVPSESRFGDSQVRQQMSDMLRTFSSSDAVVHSVDLSGLSARGDARSGQAEVLFRSGRESLSEIASISGGRLFKDVNDVGVVFRELSEMSRRYYLLAFEPEGAVRPGPLPQAQGEGEGRRARASPTAAGTSSAADYATRSPLARRFEAAEMIAKARARGEIPVSVLALPYVRAAGKVARAGRAGGERRGAAGRGRAGQARARALRLRDRRERGGGGLRGASSPTSTWPRSAIALKQTGLQAHATFTLPPGRHSLRFLLRDAVSGRSATHWMEVSIPDTVPNEVVLLPPMFMDDPDELADPARAVPRPPRAPASPFQVARSAFAPRPRPVIANGREERVCLLALDGNRQYDAGASFEIVPVAARHAAAR